MTENHPPESTPPEAEQPLPDAGQPAPDAGQPAADAGQPLAPEPAEDPGYLTETGEAAGEDGSVVPIIGGLPAVEGSAWDIGAPADERGTALAEHEASEDSPRTSSS